MKVQIIDNNIESVSYKNTYFNILDCGDDYILVGSSLHELDDLKPNNLHELVTIQIHNETGFNTYLFYEIEIFLKDKIPFVSFICHQPNKYWEGSWGLRTFINGITDTIKYYPQWVVTDIEVDDDWKRLVITHELNSDKKICDLISELAIEINKIIKETEIALAGIRWKKEYETDEKLFCLEVIMPLLRRMNFQHIRYTHGTREYGKDFTFSEMNSFGYFRYYGLQAKAGNISGGVNSDIDELIGQLDDAFKMPYYELGNTEQRYISTFIIAISGKFTDNAKEKIINKIQKGLYGSIYFIDRDFILELIEKYWIKK